MNNGTFKRWCDLTKATLLAFLFLSGVIVRRADETLARPSGGGGFAMLMGGEPCTTTNEVFLITSITADAQGWITITWESCTNFLYETQTSEELSTQTVWSAQTLMIGQDGVTSSWKDTNAPSFDHRFYRVERLAFDEPSTHPFAHGLTNMQVYQNPSVLIADNYSTLGDGIPDWWKVTYGFSLTDPSVASADSDGDGVNNLTEYLQGRDPTKDAVADTSGLVNLNVFTPLE